MQSVPIRFATPPRRHVAAAQPADAELAKLTAGVSLAHDVSRPRQPTRVGSASDMTGATSTPSDFQQRRKPKGPTETLRAWPMDISPTEQRPQHRRTSVCGAGGVTGELNSPCGSPRVRLSGALSGRSSLTRPQFGASGSFCRLASGVCRGVNHCDNNNNNNSTTASSSIGAAIRASGTCTGVVPGVSPLLSVTPSETDDEGTTTGGESSFPSSAAEPLAGLRSVAADADVNARPPSSPFFAYFPGSGNGVRGSGSPFARERSSTGSANFAFSPPFGSRSVCDAGPGSINSSCSTEQKFFEPLCFNGVARPFSPLHRRSWNAGSQRPSCVPALEPCVLDSAIASAKERDLDASHAPLSASNSSLGEVVRQQQLLHACLVSMARERTELSTSLRGSGSHPSSPAAVTPRPWRRGSRLFSVLYLLLTVLLRLPFHIMVKALSEACRLATRVFC